METRYATRSRGKVEMVLYEPIRKPRTKLIPTKLDVLAGVIKTAPPPPVQSVPQNKETELTYSYYNVPNDFFEKKNMVPLSVELVGKTYQFFVSKPKTITIKDTPEFSSIKLKYFNQKVNNQRPKIDFDCSQMNLKVSDLQELINDYEDIVQLMCYKRNRTNDTRGVLSSFVALLRYYIGECDAIILSNMNEAKFKTKNHILELSPSDFLIAKN
jgi:hypothetical protein